ncbi:DUF2510 domain-containing protein [Sphaerisporangium rubeum]|uniref:DUF2510 domain-containing protein n=1 Tax=Sphaerisporangium rubeum TaxID=321317 RepID=A0A7X0IHX9_9ACTN|nr:DUF2510 domain-containing protein [Sphaerisporangium rubeum]MBB6475501.1 hypothetical protein [Sphaerisporangium rubeum]
MTQTPAGWYPDPYGTPQLRWWDGTQWTDATHPVEGTQGQGPVSTGQWAQPGTGPQASPQGRSDTGPQQAPQDSPGTGPQQSVSPGTGPQNTGPQPSFQPNPGASSYPLPGGGQTGPSGQPGPSGQSPATGPYGGPGQFGQPGQGTAPYGGPGQGTAQYGGPGPYGQQRTEQYGAAGLPSYAGQQNQQPWGGGGTTQLPSPHFGAPPPPKKRSPLPWVLGGGAVVILLVVALVIGLSLVNNGTPTAGTGATPEPSDIETLEPLDPQVTPPLEQDPSPAPSASDSLPAELAKPDGDKIKDPRSGLEFYYPGGSFTVPSWADVNGNGPADPRFPRWTGGYQAPSQENYDGQGNDWLGTVLSGRLPDAFEYSGPADLRKTTGELLLAYEPVFYSPPHKRKGLKDEAIDVSGKKGWVLRFRMDFTEEAKKAGWKWKTEEGAFVVVDQGPGQRPSMLYVSVPDNLDTSLIDRVLDSLKAS